VRAHVCGIDFHKLSKKQVFQFDVWMAVLVCLWGGFGANLDGLLRTGVQAGEANGAMRTDSG